MKTIGGDYKNNKIKVGKRTSYNNRQYSRGMELYKSKRFKEAIPYLEAEIIEHKEDERTIFILGKCYSKIRNIEKAQELYERVLSLNENDKYAILEMGKIYIGQGKNEEAKQEFEKYIKIDKDETPHAHLELGKLYASQGKIKEAEQEFKKYIEIDKDRTPHAHLELGKLYAREGKNEEAKQEFEKCTKIDKDDIYSLHELEKLHKKIKLLDMPSITENEFEKADSITVIRQQIYDSENIISNIEQIKQMLDSLENRTISEIIQAELFVKVGLADRAKKTLQKYKKDQGESLNVEDAKKVNRALNLVNMRNTPKMKFEWGKIYESSEKTLPITPDDDGNR